MALRTAMRYCAARHSCGWYSAASIPERTVLSGTCGRAAGPREVTGARTLSTHSRAPSAMCSPVSRTTWTASPAGAYRWRSSGESDAAREPEESVGDDATAAVTEAPGRVGLIEAMVRARVHYGHAPGLWNPKMAPYIAGQRAGMHVIDLDKTAVALEKALHMIRGVVEAKGTILFVNTRSQFETMTRRAAIACGEHFVVRKWVGGTLTNSDGVLGLSTRADLVVMLSMPVLQSAIRDTSQLCIPTIGIADTDCDPTKVTIAIPGNDDSEDSIRFFLDVMCNAIIAVKENRLAASEETAATRGARGRSSGGRAQSSA